MPAGDSGMTKPNERVRNVMLKQKGLISRAQATAAGLTTDQLKRLTRSGTWRLVAHRVFAVEPVVMTWPMRAMAACLSSGGDAYLSFSSAAHLWRLDGFSTAPRRLDVSSRRQTRIADSGVVWHRLAQVNRGDFTTIDGLPVTSLPRTLADLAMSVNAQKLEMAFSSAIRRQPKWYAQIAQYVGGAERHRPWVAALTRLLNPDACLSESALEVLVKRLVFAAQVPAPTQQYEVHVGGRFVARLDFAWPQRKLAIQAQGYQFHHGRQRFEVDAKQLSQLAAHGWLVLQVTWRRAQQELAQVIEELRHAWHSAAA